MSTWNIYHKDGTKLQDENGKEIVVHSLEYSDTWMGECFVTITFENEAPIDFAIGDYVEYRGEKFEINYDPGKIKVSSRNSYGAAFKYDSVKFNSLSDELVRCEFLDVVLSDNNLHYTALPKFSFYVSSLDDLLDRILANLNEQIGENEWKLFSRNLERSKQRGCTEAEWNEMYGEGTEDNAIESKSITIDQKTCWEALALVNSEWDVNFIVRGRNVYVGTAGLPTANIFKYGKGNGLYEIEQNAESDQSVITRLRAYGSDKNLPSHYYADLGKTFFSEAKLIESGEDSEGGTYVLAELTGLAWPSVPSTYFSQKSTVSQFDESYKIKIKSGTTAISGVVWNSSDTTTRFKAQSTWYDVSADDIQSFANELNSTGKIYFVSGVNGGNLPGSNVAATITGLPNNMACSRLMLPGFPSQSLQEYWDSLTDAEKKYANPSGKEHRFSTDKYRPYIDSLNIDEIGMRQGSVYFDTDDESNGIIEIYPSMEEMTTSTGRRLDEIYKGSEITDDGRFEDGQTIANFTLLLRPEIDFDINDLKQSDFAIHMQDGMCGGREFSVEASSKDKETGCWKLTLARQKDDALEIYFPYKDYQINAGDHFVLTGIELPDSYIKAASLKLLKWAIAYLDENDYTRYVYQPKVDEIFMARQHDEYLADTTGAKKSLYLTLKAGDLLSFEDSDLNISGEVSIDTLSIKEDEGKIPTYEVTLREDKEVGTIKKIQNQISSLSSGNGGSGGGGGATVSQTKNIVQSEGSKYFLSKLSDDTAQGHITFNKGLTSKDTVKFGNNGAQIDKLGNALLESLRSLDYANAAEQGFSIEKEDSGKYHEYITNLTVWGKAIFHELEIRKLSYAGGNVYLSGAGSKLVKVVPVVWDSDSSSWTASTDAECEGWKCYLLADDGTTATQNYWQENDQVRCQTFGQITAAGSYTDVSNKAYWRTIPKNGVSTANEKIYADDGTTELYDGQQFAWIVIGKHSSSLDGYTEDTAPTETKDYPATGDTIVLDGNRGSDTTRQNIIILETTGDDAPRIAGYHNISDYEHTAANYVFLFSAKEGVTLNSSCFKWMSADGSETNMPNYCGDWTEGTTYYKNDQVSHNNAVWICIANSGVGVTDEPSDTSSNWKKVLSGGKGDKGDSGDGVVMAYKNADTQPSKPTVTDLSQLASEGWSRTPYGSTINKVDNITYGDFSVGAGTTVLANTEWSDITYGGYTWKKSPSGLSDKYGWAAMKVSFVTNVDNIDVTMMLVANSEQNNDGIVLFKLDYEITFEDKYDPMISDNTKSGLVSGPNVSESRTYHVEKAGEHFIYAVYHKNGYDSGGIQVSYGTDCALFRIDLPDNQIASSSSTTWMSQAILRNEQAVLPWSDPVKITGEDGAQGANGNDGKSALEIVVSPDTLVFDTDDNGLVSSSASKSATITCYRDGTQVTNIDYQLGDHDNCGASASFNNGIITITVSNIATDTISANSTTYKVSKTSGTVDVSITDNSTGTTYKAQVKFAVNVSKFTGGIMADNKKFQTVYNELTNNGTDTDLTDFKSEIAQTAREISLEVSQKAVGRRNLLVGSAARKYGEGWTYMSGGASYNGVPVERIEINSGIDGTNCLHCYGSSSYAMGLHWVGTSPQGNVKLEKGKTYTLSCYVKTNAAEYVKFYLETHMMSSATTTSRSYSNYHNVAKYIDYSDTWTLITNTFTMSESYEYAEICIYAYPTSGTRDIYFCRPMLEEGDTANGWTLSEQDYDYVGGNLLDNTRTLTLEGNLTVKNGTLIEEGYGGSNVQHTDCSNSSSSMDNLQWYNQSSSPLTIALNNDYVFSFMAKGSGTLTSYCYCKDKNESTVQYENSDGKSGTATDGRNTITLTSQWKRYWVHWKAIASPLPTSVIIRCPGYCDAYVSQPKLEEGATITEWTERKADLIDKASLKAAGISISSSSVELYGDQIKVSSTKGGTPTALFKDGKVTASHIDVTDLMAQSMTATNLTVTGSSTLGIFHIRTSSATDRDAYNIDGDMIGFSGTYRRPDGIKEVTDDSGYTFLTYKPLFMTQGVPDNGQYMRLGTYYTEWDDIYSGNLSYNYLFVGAAAKRVCSYDTSECALHKLPTKDCNGELMMYNTNYNPSLYLYSVKTGTSDPAMVINVKKHVDAAAGTRLALVTNGAICGVFAPNTVITSSSEPIGNTIGTVICTNTSEITVTLPPNPTDGQKLLVVQGASGKVNFKPNGKTLHRGGDKYTDTSKMFYSQTEGQFNMFVYINGEWWMQYHN